MIRKALSIGILVLLGGLLLAIGYKSESSALVHEEEPYITVCKTDRYVLLDTVPLDADEQLMIQEASYKYGIDYRLAMAVLESETHFTWVTGDLNLKHCAIGYFQISTINAERMAEDYGLDIYDKMQNLEAGVAIISELMEKFPNGYAGFNQEQAAIMCYKCGISRGCELMADGFLLKSIDGIIRAKSSFDL